MSDLKKCSGCGSDPVVSEYSRGGLKVECPECGRSVTEADESFTIFEFWNLINMDYAELSNFAVKNLDEERLRWLDLYRGAAGFKK